MCVSNDPPRDLLVTRYTKTFPHDLFSCSSNCILTISFFILDLYNKSSVLGAAFQTISLLINTFTSTEHNLLQENIGDNVKHEKMVSNKCLLRIGKMKDNFPALCILALNAILNIENYVCQISILFQFKLSFFFSF